MIGSIIGGRYKITGKLGEGGIGDVYKAVHAEPGSYYAVEKFRSELTREAFFQRAFLKSARSHSCLDHEGIVRVTEFFQERR